jgi:hypothetical protein
MNKKELWLKLRAYHFEHLIPTHLWDHIAAQFGGSNAFTKAFASKIAKKHDWDTDYAIKVIVEYKKFIYLGIVSDFQVTPSKFIDVVWHEHILFSKGYREFCSEIINYTFDHSPELMPIQDQTGEFSAQYADTIKLYITEFGTEPPEDIWDTTKYDKTKIADSPYTSRKKRFDSGSSSYDSNTYYSDGPLCTNFDGSAGDSIDGGGDFSGGGAGGDWSDGDSATGDSGSDSSGDGGGDGGSGCSSSCGGGCGGGD